MCFPPKRLWADAVEIIKSFFQLSKRQEPIIYRVFTRCEEERNRRNLYDGKRSSFVRADRRLLDAKGIEGQIMADVLQNGGNIRGATEVVNRWRKSEGKNEVSVSAVQNCVNKFMMPKKVPSLKISSGSYNAYSPWARASYCWAKQMAICYGVIDPYTFEDPEMPAVPPGTNPDWVAAYHANEEQNKKRISALIAADNEKRAICPLYASQPRRRILLPEYDPNLLTHIIVRADWDETHP